MRIRACLDFECVSWWRSSSDDSSNGSIQTCKYKMPLRQCNSHRGIGLYSSYIAGGKPVILTYSTYSLIIIFTVYLELSNSFVAFINSWHATIFWICFLAPSVDPRVRCHCQPPHTIKANCYIRSPGLSVLFVESFHFGIWMWMHIHT